MIRLHQQEGGDIAIPKLVQRGQISFHLDMINGAGAGSAA